jgi:hypothetical protein
MGHLLSAKEPPLGRQHSPEKGQTMKSAPWSLARIALFAFTCLQTTGDASAQGLVNLANNLTGVIDAPFFDKQGVRLMGTNNVAQLYYWSTVGPEIGFKPADGTTPFYSITNGYGYFTSSVRELPGVDAQAPAWVQVRAWAVVGGSSFEEAALAGAWTGQSKILFVPATGGPGGGVPRTPANLIGLEYPGEPLVVQPPQSRTILPGESATLTVVASTGVAGFYQWYQQPSNRPDGLIPGATNATYTTPPVLANTTYWVAISNSAGSTLSAPATLTVLPSPPQLSLQLDNGLPVLTLSAAPGLAYRIDYRTNFTTAVWTPLVELSLSTSPFTFTDPAASNTPARFYRAVPP